MENLWPEISETPIEKNETISILREQARLIKHVTGNKICGTFSRMNYKANTTDTVNFLGEVIASMAGHVQEEQLEIELADKTDANVFYDRTKYKFEIYNADYRFRLFVFNYSDIFPVSLDIDSGILNEIEYMNNDPINSNGELKKVLREVFASKKVITIINRMMQKS